MTLDGNVPVLEADNGKRLRMGLDRGLPQFYVKSRSGTAEWFMRIHPDELPNGMQPGSYDGNSDDGTPRTLTITAEGAGSVRVACHKPGGTSGRFVIVDAKELDEAWAYTLDRFNRR